MKEMKDTKPLGPFTIRDRDGNIAANITDSDITRFRETNNLTNADLIMEVKYSNTESEMKSATMQKEREAELDRISPKLDADLSIKEKDHQGSQKGKTFTILLKRDESRDAISNPSDNAQVTGASDKSPGGLKMQVQEINQLTSTGKTSFIETG